MTETQRKPTCEERVDAAMKSRLNDIRIMLCGFDSDDLAVDDNGDICLPDIDVEGGSAVDFIDSDGDLDTAAYMHSNESVDLREACYERWHEYGLGFDYVPAHTFDDQDEGYWRYQLSWGGPSEEIRFYCSLDTFGPPLQFSCHRAEFWYLDWFDGAHRVCTSEPAVRAMFEWFTDVGAFDSALQAAQ